MEESSYTDIQIIKLGMSNNLLLNVYLPPYMPSPKERMTTELKRCLTKSLNQSPILMNDFNKLINWNGCSPSNQTNLNISIDDSYNFPFHLGEYHKPNFIYGNYSIQHSMDDGTADFMDLYNKGIQKGTINVYLSLSINRINLSVEIMLTNVYQQLYCRPR